MLVDDHDSQKSDHLPTFTAGQRRVLGVLIEKGLTTPEYYPMTLKALVAGCSQKSNRSPVAAYSPERVQDVLDELRAMGLVAEIHTESGRTARFRHHVRQNVRLTEPQLAILTELLLRGRQRLGELRTRASRMVPIERQDDLRDALGGLIERDMVRSNGPLERRGIEVDHCLYDAPPEMPGAPPPQRRQPETPERSSQDAAAADRPAAVDNDQFERLTQVESVCQQLLQDNAELRRTVHSLERSVAELMSAVQRLTDEWEA